MPVKRRQNLAEADKGSYCREECLEESLDNESAFYNGNKVIIMMRIVMKIMNRSSYRWVLPIVATKYSQQFFYKN